jgi:hypothetical protein
MAKEFGPRQQAASRGRARTLAPLLAALAGVLTMAPIATGTVIRGEDISNYSYGYDDCGFTVEVVGQFSSPRSMARVGTGPDASAFFGHDRYTRHETHTRVGTGDFLEIDSHGLLHEVSAQRVEGDVFEFTIIDVGGLATVRDADGAVVARDRGSITTVYLLDTGGDAIPGGDFLGVLSESHRGRFGADLCALFPS